MDNFKQNRNYVAVWIIGFIILALVLWYFVIDDKTKLEVGDSAVLGDENASVTIYEFSDFSCPYCAAAAGHNEQVMNYLKSRYPGWEAPIPLIIGNYVKTGKAKIVFKYYPGHGAATKAHMMALALKEQNNTLFWDFADKAFSMQSVLDDWDSVYAIATSLGADLDAAKKSIEENNYQAILAAEFKMGQDNKVEGTPAFFINGEKISGAVSYSQFKEIIDRKLS